MHAESSYGLIISINKQASSFHFIIELLLTANSFSCSSLFQLKNY